ncbi:MAG: GTPase ObgE [Patescibacteria group bacterium]|nr:GTPase ObgE [Patescibacteria group bacterium]
MLVDEITIYAEAGNGGKGVVRWRHEKFISKGGPAGGDGGEGGDVYAETIRDVYLLAKYKHKKEFKAENGEEGKGRSRHGADGEDLIIKFPVGSIITNIESGASVSLEEVGQKELLLKGGKGGFGNERFKSSVNTTPKKATKGELGERGNFKIELELFADTGLIGLPNAGKSSLLNALTNAQAKIGSYQFTTLDPNFGDFHGYILADIPGLIEGASKGKGLGIKFLKHIKRTKMLVHLISLENEDPIEVYNQIRNELKEFDPSLIEKDEIILLTKSDLVDDVVVEEIKDKFDKNVFVISLYDDESIKNFTDELVKLLRKI